MAAPLLRIRLFGELEVRVDEGPPLVLASRRAEALLAHLLLHRGASVPRGRLAGLLWPDSTQEQARTNLRHLLHTLRRVLPEADAHLEVTKDHLGWRDAGPFWLDVAAFESALVDAHAGDGDGDDGVSALRDAVGLYRGDLLPGHDDDWVLIERERLRLQHVTALEQVAVRLEARGEVADAVGYAQRLVRDDPLREASHQLLIRLHGARGDRARALRAYHACAATLADQLGVAPSPATRAAYEALLGGGEAEPASEVAPRRAGAGARPVLVGRVRERSQLTDLWRATRSGRSGLVVVTGEPGVGKSRLVEEFRRWVARQGVVTAVARSYRAEGELAFGPVVTWLRSDAYARSTRQLDPSALVELASVLPQLDAGEAPGHPGTQERRRATFEALAAALRAPAAALLVADDLQWADRDTLQFLHFLLRSDPAAPILVVATARDDQRDAGHPLTDLVTALRAADAVTEIELDRLAAQETAALAELELGRPLTLEEAARLQAETEGNPLFVLEALRAGWDGTSGDDVVVTPRVQAVIESRLQQLSGDARRLLGLAATVGRAFTAEVLAAVGLLGDDDLVPALDELWRHRLIRHQGADAYDFSHDRIRDVAYASLGPAQRRQHHLRLAVALQDDHGTDADTVGGQVAAHLEAAGDVVGAVRWYQRAAAVAQRAAACEEAVRLLDRGLGLLAQLPSTVETRALELSLVTGLCAPLGAVGGWSSPRLDVVRARGLALAHDLGVAPAAPLVQSLGIAQVAQGEFRAAARAAAGLVTRGGDLADDAAVVQGEYLLGIAAFWNGQLDAARRHFEAAVSRHHPDQVPLHLALFGIDPKVVCLSRLSNTLWFLGHPQAARTTCQEAIACGRRLGHGHSLGIAHVFAGLLAVELRDLDGLRTHVQALEDDARLRMRPAEVSAAILRACLDALDGRPAAATEWLTSQLVASGEPDQAPGLRASMARVLAEACRFTADHARGVMVVDRALEIGGAVRVWEAELRRLRAEFRAAQGAATDEVADELAASLAVARGQGARAYELRALTSLLHLRLEPSRAHEHRRMLAAVLDELPELAASPEGRAAAGQLVA